MRLDGFGLFVEDMAKMIRFYRDVLGFEIKESEDTSNVYLVKDETLFLLYGRKDFENMTHRRYEYIKGLNGHSEIALYVDTFEEVDMAYNNSIKNGATSVLEPELEPWGQRTCYIADPEGNLIEIGSWNKVYVVAGGHRCGHGHTDADQLAGFGVDAAQGLIDEQHGAFQRCVRLVAQRQGERVLSDD